MTCKRFRRDSWPQAMAWRGQAAGVVVGVSAAGCGRTGFAAKSAGRLARRGTRTWPPLRTVFGHRPPGGSPGSISLALYPAAAQGQNRNRANTQRRDTGPLNETGGTDGRSSRGLFTWGIVSGELVGRQGEGASLRGPLPSGTSRYSLSLWERAGVRESRPLVGTPGGLSPFSCLVPPRIDIPMSLQETRRRKPNHPGADRE